MSTHTAEPLSFMCCVFEDKEGGVHYIIGKKIISLNFTFCHSEKTRGQVGGDGQMVTWGGAGKKRGGAVTKECKMWEKDTKKEVKMKR